MCLEGKIKEHSEGLRKSRMASTNVCQRCQRKVERFQLHERRPRVFLVVVALVVKRVEGWLARWKCPLCGKTFTDYAGLAVPHKRYVAANIWERCGGYVGGEAGSYEKAAEKDGRSLLYEGQEGEKGKALAGSTVWRWVRFVGGLKETLRKGLKMIKEKSAGSTAHRVALPEGQKKRAPAVMRAQHLFLVGHVFESLYDRTFFPDFAITCGLR